MSAFTYGKQSVPVFKILRGKDGKDSIIDMVVNIMLEGDIADSWLSGNNKGILPTETQKNTCYALAMKTNFDAIEDYGKALLEDILRRHKHLSAGTVRIRERRWERIGGVHAHAFKSSRDPIERTCEIRVSRFRRGSKITKVDLVRSGVCGVKLLKTTQSGFDGFIRDEYTNLEPVGKGAKGGANRILSTIMDATWTYTNPAPWGRFVSSNANALKTLLETFSGPPNTGVFSKSLQETTWKMGKALLRKLSRVESVKIDTPNVHFYRYPLEQFSLENPNVVFQSTDPESTASGRIETFVRRHDLSRL
jgi:urate oxidase